MWWSAGLEEYLSRNSDDVDEGVTTSDEPTLQPWHVDPLTLPRVPSSYVGTWYGGCHLGE